MKRDALFQTLNHAYREALEKLTDSESSAAVVDLYLFPNPESGDFTIYDDEDNILVKVPVPVWEEQYESMDTDASLNECESILREIVNKTKEEGLYENLNILKPFSILMVDEEMETISELLMIDEEQLLLDDDFLKHMDEELDGFFKQLMSDI
jgi:hypothetical protein